MFSRFVKWFPVVIWIGLSGLALGADEEKRQAAYFALKPSIVSNLSGGPKYIRCDIQLMTKQPDELYKVQIHAPALRHAILMLIAGEDGKLLMSREGKEKLRTDALAAVQDTLKTMTGKKLVDDLYFTAYYVK